jgi:hypothetical protein
MQDLEELLLNIAASPSTDDECDTKRDVALILWHHLTPEARERAWEDLAAIRRRVAAWVVL